MKPTNKLHLAIVTVALLSATPFAFTGCSKEEKQSSAPVATKASAVHSVSDQLSAQVTGTIPQNSFGFYSINFDSPAYNKYNSSPWSKNLSGFEGVYSGSGKDATMTGLIKSLQEVGIDPFKAETVKNLFVTLTAYAAPKANAKPEDEIKADVGLVLKNRNNETAAKIAALKESLKKSAEFVVTDEQTASGNIFSIKHKATTPESTNEIDADKSAAPEATDASEKAAEKPLDKTIFIGWNDKVVALSIQKATVETHLAGQLSGVPAFFSQPQFAEISANSPAYNDSYAFGYVDFPQIMELEKAINGADAIPTAIPIKAMYINQSMTTTPASLVRVTYDQAMSKYDLASSTSKHVTTIATKSPILLLSIDGSLVKLAANTAIGQEGTTGPDSPPNPLQPTLDALKSITRLSLVASTAPAGRTMMPFPIPDIALAIETTQVAQMQAQLKMAGQMAASASQMGNMSWQEKDIDGVKVDAIDSPMGIGLYIANVNNALIVSTTTSHLSELLKAAKTPQANFIQTAPAKVKDNLVTTPSLINFTSDLKSVAEFLQSLRDLAQMYAPNQDTNQVISDATLTALKTYGIAYGGITHKPGMFEISLALEPAPAATPAAK